MAKTIGEYIADDLPVKDDLCDSDLISLVDIVVTGIETPWTHFRVEGYDPEADGVIKAWARLYPLPESADASGLLCNPALLTAESVRKAVAAYMDSRIAGGIGLEEARKLVDGSYTDAVIADSILQWALYGEDVFS